MFMGYGLMPVQTTVVTLSDFGLEWLCGIPGIIAKIVSKGFLWVRASSFTKVFFRQPHQYLFISIDQSLFNSACLFFQLLFSLKDIMNRWICGSVSDFNLMTNREKQSKISSYPLYEVAQTITIVEQKIICSLSSRQFLSRSWMLEKSTISCNNISRYYIWFSNMVNWVSSEIVSTKTIPGRADLITWFIELASVIIFYFHFIF